MALDRKKPGKLVLFKNFVKNHPQIMKREKGRGGIDYIQYKAEVVEPLVVPFMKAIDQQRPHDPDNLESRIMPLHIRAIGHRNTLRNKELSY